MAITTLGLAYIAGLVSILSPCVWPLLPMTLSAGQQQGTRGMLTLGLGLSIAFAFSGSLLSYILVLLNIDPELFRYIAAVLMALAGVVLLVPRLGSQLTLFMSRHMSALNLAEKQWAGPFATGLLTGIIWLPCVGPTLGAAIALASQGQNLVSAFFTMMAFGLGTASVMVVAGLLSRSLFQKVSGRVMSGGHWSKMILGAILLIMGLLVLTGGDKLLEVWALGWLPEWIYEL